MAQKGGPFLEEITRIQRFKKAKSDWRPSERLHGGAGVGIFMRERGLYDTAVAQYKKSWDRYRRSGSEK